MENKLITCLILVFTDKCNQL